MMIIKAEHLAGTDIKEAIADAIRVAKILNCTIESDLNGIVCLADPEGCTEKGYENYCKAMKDDKKYINCF